MNGVIGALQARRLRCFKALTGSAGVFLFGHLVLANAQGMGSPMAFQPRTHFSQVSANANDAPSAIHLALCELPVLALAFAKLDGRDPCTLRFPEIGD